jgi:hypothetical protein
MSQAQSQSLILYYRMELDVIVTQEDGKYLHQFVIHAALDFVDETMWTNNNMFVQRVDLLCTWGSSSFY